MHGDSIKIGMQCPWTYSDVCVDTGPASNKTILRYDTPLSGGKEGVNNNSNNNSLDDIRLVKRQTHSFIICMAHDQAQEEFTTWEYRSSVKQNNFATGGTTRG